MSRLLKHIITSIVFILIFGIKSGFAQQNEIIIDSLRIVDGVLRTSFHADELFTDEVLESMNKGIGISVNYQINLWRKRSSWFDKSEKGEEIFYKVKYNKFNEQFILESAMERRVTSSRTKVMDICAFQSGFALADISDLKPGNTYYVQIKGILKPHSIEDMEDVKDWLSGEIDDVDLKTLKNPKQSQEKVSGRIFNILKNITGFGDRIYNGTSREFTVTSDSVLTYINRIVLRN